MAFPTSPTNGQIYTSPNGTQYQYVLADDAWRKIGSAGSASAGAGTKNRIINGAMEIDQRNEGASLLTNSPSGTYTLDRWVVFDNSDGDIAVQQDSSVPADEGFQNSIKLTANTNDVSIAAGQFSLLCQHVEGYNIHDLSSGDMTLSFWVRSSLTGTYSISFRNIGADRSYIADYTIDVADTWEKKTITADLLAGVASGTWDFANGIGISVFWSLAAGSTFHGTVDTWNNGNFLSSSSQVNWMNTVSNTFYVTGVQLESGGAASEFDFRNISDELTLCQRYYYKTYSQGTVPGTATFVNSHVMQPHNPISAQGHVWWNARWGPSPMRAAPSLTTYSPGNGSSGNFEMNSNSYPTGTAFLGDTEGYIFNSTTGMAVNTAYVHYVVNAEL